MNTSPSGRNLAPTSSRESGLVPVHIGQPEPGSPREQALLQQLAQASGRYGGQQTPRVPGDLDWQRHGLQPRWLGMETSDCAAALEPGYFSGRGDDERDRFLAGAGRRGELALVVAAIGDAGNDRPRQVLWTYDSSVQLPDMVTSVSGRRLPEGSRPTIAPGLSHADHDLAARLLNRPGDGTWRALDLSGSDVERPGYGRFHYEAQGRLQPILTDGLGDPVVAAWIPPSNDQRWYIIPDGTDWDTVLSWLSQQALPEYVPGALRRARSPHFRDPDMQTTDELTAQQALQELEARHAEEKLRLVEELREAEELAEPVRYGLLYGTGPELVRAVDQVLTAAGLHTTDLDEELGGTKSADLLVGAGGPPWRLVEVKAAGGAAGESLVSYLQKHLDTWPQMGRGELVSGGVLIVNHQQRLHPSERTAAVYSRPEFVGSLPVTVLSTIELFDWWRTADWASIRAAVLGAEPYHATTDPGAGEDAATPPGPPSRRPWWRPGRQDQ